MRWNLRILTFLFTAFLPSAVWATEGAVPLGAVFLSGAGAATVGFAGFLCLKLYTSLKGGELGAAWQSVAFALFFLAVALVVDTAAAATWLNVPAYVTGLLRVLAAVGLVVSLLRFARVFR